MTLLFLKYFAYGMVLIWCVIALVVWWAKRIEQTCREKGWDTHDHP